MRQTHEVIAHTRRCIVGHTVVAVAGIVEADLGRAGGLGEGSEGDGGKGGRSGRRRRGRNRRVRGELLEEEVLVDGFAMDDGRDRDVEGAKEDARGAIKVLHPDRDDELAVGLKVGLGDVEEEGFVPLHRTVGAEHRLCHVLLLVQ